MARLCMSFLISAAVPGHLAELPADPRLPTLGHRGLVRHDEGRGASAQPRSDGSAEKLYLRHRYSLGVAEGPTEIPEGADFSLYHCGCLQV